MAATATLEGNSHWAMLGAQKVSEHVHPSIMQEPGWGTLQHYYTIPYYVAVKFRKWDEILNLKLETYDLKYPKAVRHYAEGMAYLGKGNIEKAKVELSELENLSKDEDLKNLTIWDINSVFELVQIAQKVLKSEILAEEGQLDTSIAILKEAVAIEDALNYNEPPDWFFSIRHHLGLKQLKAKQYNEAIVTFTEDLKYFPKNGWAYHGLRDAYAGLGDTENIAKMNALISESWAYADYNI